MCAAKPNSTGFMDTETPKGLTTAEVAARVAAGQTNDAHEQTSRSISDILRANILTRFNALLVALFIVVLAVGSPVDGLFGLVVVFNSAIGIFQEVRAKRTLDRLAILHAPVAVAIRDDKEQTIPLKQVVLDDVIKLRIGDQVPADAIVLVSRGLEIDESLLTGEADSIMKSAGDKVLSGSIVVAGEGYVRAVAVGVNAYAHSITAQVKRFKIARSELIHGTNKLLGYISLIILVVAPLLIWGQIVRSGNTWQEAMVRSIAAIVGMVPEGLVLLTSLAFMVATLALVRHKVLVQQLPAVEGLARVDVICLDKTGTLTEGKIVLDEIQMLEPSMKGRTEQVLAAFASEPNSPTLQALHDGLSTGPIDNAAYVVPFSSARKWSAMRVDGEYWVMGAPEMVWANDQDDLSHSINEIARRGKRVLILLKTSSKPAPDQLPLDMLPVALIVLTEKIRDDARETLKYFNQQGVTLKVISGDSPRTVGAIAEAVGLNVGEAVDARTLPEDQDELAAILEKKHAFGRVSPEQKRAMVKALQSKNHVVAMTGDGVNDALALKDADIGIAMGSGAQATKAIAELVLLDNKFSEMPHVLAEGRRVISNIERVANLFVIKNAYSLFLALAVTVAALPYPFLPRHLSVLSALTIGIPAFFLSLAPNAQRYVPGFLRRVLSFAVPTGIVIAVLIFASYLTVSYMGGSAPLASTVAVSVVMMIGVWVLFCLARPLRYWKAALILGLAAVYVGLVGIPFTRALLSMSLQFPALLLVPVYGATGIVVVELLWRRDQNLRTRNARAVAG
jgi:cation-transporting P-type ATPase E